jgi:hypothetical protein
MGARTNNAGHPAPAYARSNNMNRSAVARNANSNQQSAARPSNQPHVASRQTNDGQQNRPIQW